MAPLAGQRGHRATGSAGLLNAEQPTADRNTPLVFAVDEALADRWVDAWLAALRAAGTSDATLLRRAEALARAVSGNHRDRAARRAWAVFGAWLATRSLSS
jgi:hypothetical protein